MERPLTEHIKSDGSTLSLKEYEKTGGYSALRKALKANSPKDVQTVVKEANLKGRGGAGFPAGKKWELALKEKSEVKYVICNADEGDGRPKKRV